MTKCPQCETIVADTTSYCPECGESIDGVGETRTPGSNVDLDRVSDSNATRDSMYYVGAVLGIIGVVFAPYVFFLVALPEAVLYHWRGRGVVDSLPSDARNNPAVRGSFLTLRWFGNFLLLLIALGIVAGVLIVLGIATGVIQ